MMNLLTILPILLYLALILGFIVIFIFSFVFLVRLAIRGIKALDIYIRNNSRNT